MAEIPTPHHLIAEVNAKHHTQLTGTLRFENFRKNETPQLWVERLGPDALALTHPAVTASLTQQFISEQYLFGSCLNEVDRALLHTAAWVHDWGELKIDGQGIGDVPFDQKNGEHERIEAWVFTLVIDSLPPEPGKCLIEDAYNNVVRKGDPKLGEMFNCIERAGYLQTTLRAYQGVKGERIDNWRGMVANVLSNQTEVVLGYAERYPFMSMFLHKKGKVITAMFNETQDQEVPLNNTQKPSYRPELLKEAHQCWLTTGKRYQIP